MSFEYSFADGVYVIKETIEKTYILCEELKNVIDSFIHNKVFLDPENEMIVVCKEHGNRLELNSAVTYFGNPIKIVDGIKFSVQTDGSLKPFEGYK